MDQKMTRRRLLGTGAALAAAAPLAALPFPAGIEPAPVAADTTKTELTDDDHQWIADHQAKTWFGDRVTTPSNRTTSYHYPTALHVPEENAHYHPVMEFIRRSERQQDGWQVRRDVKARAAWVWGVPEPLRAGLLAVIDDIATTADTAITSALPDVLYAHIEAQAGVNVGDDDDDEYQELTDAQKLAALRAPTRIAAVVLALSAALEIDPAVWLNAGDLALLRQAIEA